MVVVAVLVVLLLVVLLLGDHTMGGGGPLTRNTKPYMHSVWQACVCMFHLIQGLPYVILAQGLRAKIAKAGFLFPTSPSPWFNRTPVEIPILPLRVA